MANGRGTTNISSVAEEYSSDGRVMTVQSPVDELEEELRGKLKCC